MTHSTYEFINLDYLELMSDGDQGMKKILLEMVIKELQNEIPVLRELYEQKDWTQLREVSHKMKSTLSFVGNDNMSSFNKELEICSKNRERLETLPGLLTGLESLCPKVVTELKKEHAKL